MKLAYQAPDNPGEGLKPGHITLEREGEGLELEVLCRGFLQDGEGGQAHGQEGGCGHGVGQQQLVLLQQRQQAGVVQGREGKAGHRFILTRNGPQQGFHGITDGFGVEEIVKLILFEP